VKPDWSGSKKRTRQVNEKYPFRHSLVLDAIPIMSFTLKVFAPSVLSPQSIVGKLIRIKHMIQTHFTALETLRKKLYFVRKSFLIFNYILKFL